MTSDVGTDLPFWRCRKFGSFLRVSCRAFAVA